VPWTSETALAAVKSTRVIVERSRGSILAFWGGAPTLSRVGITRTRDTDAVRQCPAAVRGRRYGTAGRPHAFAD